MSPCVGKACWPQQQRRHRARPPLWVLMQLLPRPGTPSAPRLICPHSHPVGREGGSHFLHQASGEAETRARTKGAAVLDERAAFVWLGDRLGYPRLAQGIQVKDPATGRGWGGSCAHAAGPALLALSP